MPKPNIKKITNNVRIITLTQKLRQKSLARTLGLTMPRQIETSFSMKVAPIMNPKIPIIKNWTLIHY